MQHSYALPLSTYIQLAIHLGYGVHKHDLDKPDLRLTLKMIFVAQTPYKATVCLNKGAATLLHLSLFVTKSVHICCYIVMIIMVGYGVGGIGATIWQCIPVAGAWDKWIEANCIDSNKFWVGYAVLNVVADIVVVGLPILPIIQLQMNMREKLLVCGVFVLGSL